MNYDFNKWYEEHKRANEQKERADMLEETLLRIMSERDIRTAEHLRSVEKKNRHLKDEVRRMQLKAEEFNNKLYATGLIVNCTGCWSGRPDRAEELTEEKVKEVEGIALRLRSWWTNHRHNVAKAKALKEKENDQQ